MLEIDVGEEERAVRRGMEVKAASLEAECLKTLQVSDEGGPGAGVGWERVRQLGDSLDFEDANYPAGSDNEL